jgi:hypothetical protein
MIDDGGIGLTPVALLAEAADVLSVASYRVERDAERFLNISPERAFIAEDKYGVVVVVVYDTWHDLARGWPSAQARAVDLLSDRFTRLDRKAWDGYLVLLTPALVAEADATVHEIRYDTSRVRKIVGTGEDIRSLSDVERTLLPLLPLVQDAVEVDEGASPLQELPERLEQSVPRDLVEAAVHAFSEHRPIVEELHRHLAPER